MNDKNPFLSICIPTYNQPAKLRRALESIVPQYEECAEVIIRDDSPNSESALIVKEFQKKIPIEYFRGKKEGLDVAIIFLTQKANGRYVWWLGDDVLAPGAIKKVTDTLQKNPRVSFLYLGSGDISSEKKKYIETNEGFYEDNNQVLASLADMLGYISVTIFKRENALFGIDGAKDYIGSAWSNLYLVLESLARSKKQYYIEYPYVSGDPKLPEDPLWYDRFQVFGVNFYKVLSEFRDRFERRAIRIALHKNLKKLLIGILVARAKGHRTNLGSPTIKIRKLIKYYWKFPILWFFAPAFLLPRFVLRFLYRNYKIITK